MCGTTKYVILSETKWSRRIYALLFPLRRTEVRGSFDSQRSLRMTTFQHKEKHNGN